MIALLRSNIEKIMSHLVIFKHDLVPNIFKALLPHF